MMYVCMYVCCMVFDHTRQATLISVKTIMQFIHQIYTDSKNVILTIYYIYTHERCFSSSRKSKSNLDVGLK